MSICRPQRLEKVLSCESQLNTLQRLQRKLWGAGEGERSVLRLRVLSTQGMEFQFYAYMLFKSNSGDFQETWRATWRRSLSSSPGRPMPPTSPAPRGRWTRRSAPVPLRRSSDWM
ncbi:unnamed protein product [Effrenium voratum]|nr:unnamed protein product [Effrenium voratum]